MTMIAPLQEIRIIIKKNKTKEREIKTNTNSDLEYSLAHKVPFYHQPIQQQQQQQQCHMKEERDSKRAQNRVFPKEMRIREGKKLGIKMERINSYRKMIKNFWVPK